MVSEHELNPAAKAVLQQLLEGNARFMAGKSAADLSVSRRQALLKGQHPVATVLTCSDSRVMPGYIFDQGLGNLFNIQTAGEALDDICLASLEYGVDHLKTPLLIVLGHSDCGAVKATIAGGHAPGHLPMLIDQILPAVKICKEHAGGSSSELVNEVICENTLEIVERLPKLSLPIAEAVASKSTVIIGAHYDLETGRVEFLFDAHSLACN